MLGSIRVSPNEPRIATTKGNQTNYVVIQMKPPPKQPRD
jgi:hypothetical protein